METTDKELVARLTALEAAVPVTATPPLLPRRARRRRLALSLTLAPVVLIAVVATAAAGAIAVGSLAQARPGIENDGQPMAGLHMECMTPPEARCSAYRPRPHERDLAGRIGCRVGRGRQGRDPNGPATSAAGARLRRSWLSARRRQRDHGRRSADRCDGQRVVPRSADALTWKASAVRRS